MSALGRVGSETTAATKAFLRRRTAVFFTFFFPAILVLIFGVLVQAQPTGGGLFTEPAGYYVPGYLAVVVLFTPLSRVGSEVARHREGNRFEKLATTPLSRAEWLLAQTLVNVAIIGAAAVLILGLVVALTGAAGSLTPSLLVLPFIALAVALFCGLGAVLGRVADSQDGVVAAANGIALPLLFLSETFVPPDLLPAWFDPLRFLSPLTYFARGVREATYRPPGVIASFTPGGNVLEAGGPLLELGVLAALAVLFFVAGAYAIPDTD
ncbi:ABC transporter permease [Haloglomus irregulare]|uniref:ABC transporter permease n=1 Tax=Haloglomus irregulare TaxID=2234134 RepID=A0A554N983_9EURY|nr:ABC transporter permease [Haloglomus irregulare]TSD13922.1 ABC transporter permease [Haloglomus irregulare]